MTGVLMAGNSLREKEQEVQYAGNFDRRAEEAQKFLELIRTNAVSSKETEDGKSIIYELSKKQSANMGIHVTEFVFQEQIRIWMHI